MNHFEPRVPLPDLPDAHGREIRTDLRPIADMVASGSRVLDVGCGDGALLHYLWRAKRVDGRGLEISHEGVRMCISRGLSVTQGDADTDLADFPSGAFDCVILSQTLQTVRAPRVVLEHLVRIGRQAIVSFPNFGYWRVRLALLRTGRMPVTSGLPLQWYDTPNIHLCTIRDFAILCGEMGVEIDRSLALRRSGQIQEMPPGHRANLLAETAIFLLRRR
ncbi:MAG: methionine biosynthesis protein MetW [Rhodospirillaceae bacterium]|nr:methionine biosynthesis protein MetW [Rhodospirillaceae bacterium]